MKLYYFLFAPNPTKVRIYLAEKGLELPQQLVNLVHGEQKTPEFLAINPAGTLPVLELDDGRHVCDSNSIIEYLEERHPEPSMWGESPEDRAMNRALERTCDLGVLISVARYVHATHSPLGLPPNPALAEAALENLTGALDRIETLLEDGRSFLAGDAVTVADCTLFAGLRFGSFRDFEIDPKYGRIHAWRERFSKRPSANLDG